MNRALSPPQHRDRFAVSRYLQAVNHGSTVAYFLQTLCAGDTQ